MQHDQLELTRMEGLRRSVAMVACSASFWTVAVPGSLLTTTALFSASTEAAPQAFAGVTFSPEVAPVPAASLVDEGVRIHWQGVNISNNSASEYEVIRTGSDSSVAHVCSGADAPIRQALTDSCVDTGVLADVTYSYSEHPVLRHNGAVTWSRPFSSSSQQVLAPKLRFGGVGPVATSTTNVTTTVSFPSNAVSGDIAILIVRSARKATLTVPVGWNSLVQLSSNGPQSYLMIAWKVVGTDTSVGVQMQGTAQGSAGWVALYKRTTGNLTTPVTATATVVAENGAAAATFSNSTSITTNVNNAAVISIATVLAANTLSLSNANGYTEKLATTTTSGASGFALGIADQLSVKNGTVVNPPTWAQSGTAMLWQVATIAFS